MSSPAETMRRQLASILPEDAFLKRARADGTFITNALKWDEEHILLNTLTRAGFLCRQEGELLVISPGSAQMLAFEQSYPVPPDFLCASLLRFRGQVPDPAALTLFAAGVRLTEHSSPAEQQDYERRVRRLAAVCLREHLGGAYGCAILLYLIASH